MFFYILTGHRVIFTVNKKIFIGLVHSDTEFAVDIVLNFIIVPVEMILSNIRDDRYIRPKLFYIARQVKEDPKNSNIIYVGTDGGLYVSFNRGQSFSMWSAGLPKSVPIHDIAIQVRENEIVLGTHGRSIYVAKLPTAPVPPAKEKAKPKMNEILNRVRD